MKFFPLDSQSVFLENSLEEFPERQAQELLFGIILKDF